MRPPPDSDEDLRHPDRPDLFVSYARRDGETVWRIVAALEERGKSMWIDRDDIPPASDWRERITRGIDASRAVLFVLSPTSAVSTECGQELRLAIESNKRVIPVVVSDVDPATVPYELERTNWIFLREQDGFDAQIGLLVAALETDLQWLDDHARLTVRAREWQRGGRNPSFLLRGSDLKTAERWLEQPSSRGEVSTAHQREYIIASRHSVMRRRSFVAAAVVTALVVAGALTALAEVRAQQRRTALHQRQVADADEVAEEAAALHMTRPDLSMLLGVAAYRMAPTRQTLSTLLSEQAQMYAGALPPQRFGVLSVAFADRGTEIVAGNAGSFTVWDVATHRLVHRSSAFGLSGPVAVDPRSGVVALGIDGGVAFWNPRTGRDLPFTAHTPDIAQLAVSPDGRLLAAASVSGGTVDLVAMSSGAVVRTLHVFGRKQAVFCVAFDPVDPDVLAVVGGHETVRLVNLRTGRQLASFPGDSSPIYGSAVAFSPDGKLLATASVGNSATIWAIAGHRRLARLSATNDVEGIAFSPDGRLLATISGNTTILWNVASGSQAAQLPSLATDASTEASGVAWSPQGMLAVGSDSDASSGGDVSLWNVRGPVLADGFRVLDVAFDRSGTTLAVSYANGQVDLLDPRTHALRRALSVPASEPGVGPETDQLALSRDGRLIAAAGRNTAWVWSTATGAVLAKIPDSAVDFLQSVAFSPDGRMLLVGGTPGPAKLIDLATRRVVGHVGSPADIAGYTGISYTPDGRYIVLTGDGDVEVWSARTLREVDTFNPALHGGSDVQSYAIAPNGVTAAAGLADGTIVLWNLHTGRRLARQLRSFGSHLGAVNGLAFSPDGRMLASAGMDATVKLWDVHDTYSLIATLSGHQTAVNSVAFSRRGQLVSGGDDGAVIWWDLDPSAVIASICGTLNTTLSRADWARYVPTSAYERACSGRGGPVGRPTPR